MDGHRVVIGPKRRAVRRVRRLCLFVKPGLGIGQDVFEAVVAERLARAGGRRPDGLAGALLEGEAAAVESGSDHDLAAGNTRLHIAAHRKVHALGIALAGAVERGVVAGDALGLQIVGHQVHLVAQCADGLHVQVADVPGIAAQGYGQHAGFSVLRGQAVQPFTQRLEQQSKVLSVIGAGGDARCRGAGILPVNVHTQKAIALHQHQRAVHKAGAAVCGGSGL